MTKRKKALNVFLFLLILGGGLAASFFLSQYVANSDASQSLIQEFGHIGIIVVSFIAGLNLFIPIPAATFVPVFTAGGISLPEIIVLLVVGTMAANLLSYFLGVYGGKITNTHYPELQKKLIGLYQKKKEWLVYLVFLFTALMPLPDEVFLIPLGIVGVKLRQFIIPLVLGTICYQTLAAFGVHNIFKYFLV